MTTKLQPNMLIVVAEVAGSRGCLEG